MKVFFNKLKKVSKIFGIIYLVTAILYLISYICLFKNIIAFTNVENIIRIIVLVVLGLWLVTYIIWNLTNLILKRHITIAITTSVTTILMVILLFVNYYLGMINHNIDNLGEKKYVSYTMNLMVLGDTKIDKNSKIGSIDNVDKVDKTLIEGLNKEYKIKANIEYYSSYYEMVYDLLNGTIDGVYLNSNNLSIFSNEEFEGMDEAKALYKYTKELPNQDSKIVSNKSLKDPFTILLMGVDSEADGLNASTSFNGDTLMMITFNPKTLNATMFSIPRDTYVPIACNNNKYAKINSSAAYGTSCVIKTIEQLTDVKIDYYVKINFKGVVDLVEALGGVDVEVEAPDYSAYIKAYKGKVCEQNSLRQFGDKLVCIDPGMQHLNGEQALAYARCRHAYLQSDIARNKHQQAIIEAIARKAANKKNIGSLDKILGAISNNLDTNMAEEQIYSFYDILKDMIAKTLDDGEFLTIQKTYLEYYNLPVRLSNNGILLSAIGYYPGSLEAIVNLMNANLGLEEKKMIKTFSFDANEDYKSKVTGQGITTGEKLITMPNFVGLAVSQAEDWTNQYNINLDIQFVDSTSPYYNPNILPGMIANQSVNNGVLINNVSELIIYVNSTDSTVPPMEEDTKPQEGNKDDKNEEEENNNNDKPEVDLPEVILPPEENDDKENDKTTTLE